MTKRLFIFAAYDRDGIVDESLIYYLRALAKLGDIIFTMDNNADQSELFKISQIPNVLHFNIIRHQEYDFGSYKRGYQWASAQQILDNYDWVYFVNDSVFGPLFDLEPLLIKMEHTNLNGAFGMMGLHDTENERYGYPDHVQSWFVGIDAKIVQNQWFAKFLLNVTHQPDKNSIVWKYEIGLSQLLTGHNIKIGRVQPKICGLKMYDGYINGIPFVKKLAICNIPKKKTLKKITPADFYDIMMASITRLELHQPPYKPLWKIKLFNKITALMLEQNKAGTEIRLWIFKLIPIKFIRYK